MAFSRVRGVGWAFGEILTSAQQNQLDIDHANAFDAVGGGSYTLSNPASWAGSGWTWTSPCTFATVSVGSNATFFGPIAAADTLDVNGVANFYDAVNFVGFTSTGLVNLEFLNVSGSSVMGDVVINGNVPLSGNLSVGGLFDVAGVSDFNDDVDIDGDLAVSGDLAVVDDLTADTVTASLVTGTNGSFGGASFTSAITFSGNGHIRPRGRYSVAGDWTLASGELLYSLDTLQRQTLYIPAGTLNAASASGTVTLTNGTTDMEAEVTSDVTNKVVYVQDPALNLLVTLENAGYRYAKFKYMSGAWVVINRVER